MKHLIVKSTHSRRNFISTLIGAGIIINIPFVSSCNYESETNILNDRQSNILQNVLTFLWPDDKFGPTHESIKAFEFFLWVLSDKNVDPEENEYLINGLKWVDETSIEEYNIHFEKTSGKQKYKILKKVLNLEWGESWLSKVLTILFEAMFADPIYGSNPEGIVWNWLDHNPGQPRPIENNKYSILLKRKEENIIVTSLNQL